MGWDVVVDGTFMLKDARAVTALRKVAFEVAPELGAGPHPFGEPARQPPDTVGEAIDSLADEAFTVGGTGGTVLIRGVWDEDTFRERAATLASVLAIAARRGASGGVNMVSLGPPLAYRLSLGVRGVDVKQLPERAHAQFANAPWVADVVEAVTNALHTPTTGEAALAGGPIERALSLLAELDDDELFACASDLPPGVSVRVKGRPVDQAWVVPTEAYPNGAALRAALFAKPKKAGERPADDWRRVFALPALANHDPARAEPLALALLANAETQELQQSAAHALGRCATEPAVDALFGALGSGALAQYALGRNTHPSVVPRAIAALDDAAVTELYAPPAFHGAYLMTRAGQLVTLLQVKRDVTALPRLLEVWARRTRSSAAHLVAATLLTFGTPEALAAAAEAISASEVEVSRTAARAFLQIDPETAFDRARSFFEADDPASKRAAAAIFGALTRDAGVDPRWGELARAIPESSPVHRAAAWFLERVEGS